MRALRDFVMDGKLPQSARFRNIAWVVAIVLLVALFAAVPTWRSDVIHLVTSGS